MVDAPDPMNAYLGRMLELQLQFGHAVQSVLACEEHSPVGYSYTVGRCVRGLPELVVSCDAYRVATVILNTVADAIGEGPVPGEVPPEVTGLKVPVRLRGPLRFGDGDDDLSLGVVEALYGADYRIEAWQVMYPDDDGHWPDEPAYKASGPQCLPQTVLELGGAP